MRMKHDSRPLVAHIVFSFDYGGLENGVVNLINGLREDAYRHAIIALTTSYGFEDRIRKRGVVVHTLNKRDGKDPWAYLRLFRLLRQLRPSVVHTRNIGTIEGALLARLAGVSRCIHGEHGWDVFDPDGSSKKYRALRRVANPAINRFVTVSRELEQWLTSKVGIAADKVQRICNGVDTERFRPGSASARRLLPPGILSPNATVVGTVTRFSPIKDPLNLVHAFIEAHSAPGGEELRLVMIGDGPLRKEAETRLREAGLSDRAWLPGSRDDIPELLREFDVFALGSLREGISNTVLEAMSTGLPVIATATGGTRELVENNATGLLVPPADPGALAASMIEYGRDAHLRRAHGSAGRARAVRDFSLQRMLADYDALYRQCIMQRSEAAKCAEL
jgi:sugar transferase (PEP-CTERM/EpsH1 system associated)